MTMRIEQWPVGREGKVKMHDLELSVIIRDIRVKMLTVDYLVEPTAGKGMIWVEQDKVIVV